MLDTGIVSYINTSDEKDRLKERIRKWFSAKSWPVQYEYLALRRVLQADPTAPPDQQNKHRVRIWKQKFEHVDNKHLKRGSTSASSGIVISVPEIDLGDFYIVKCPASIDEYDQTAEMARQAIDSDLIDLEADRNAFIRNPYTMVVLLEKFSRDVIGWIDIYHMRDEDLDLLIEKGIVDVNPNRLIDYPRSREVKRAYVATMLAKGHSADGNSGKRAGSLIYGMMDFLLKYQFVNTDSLEIFSIGATEAGERMLRRFGFLFVRQVEMEVGPRGLYSRKLKKDELKHEKEAFGSKYGFNQTFVRLEIDDPDSVG
jgi:hypothetical protein